jgi:hypothetical protein
VSYYDALRFANWLHNYQPTGAQGPLTTEQGAYTMTGPTSAGPRNPLAAVFIPSESEWHKAAYYEPLSAIYFEHPTSSEAAPTCGAPPGTPPAANCGSTSSSTDVGAYVGSQSPFGTFDQGGNVYEWTEGTNGPLQIARGGAWGSAVTTLAASSRFGLFAFQKQPRVGFRVATRADQPTSGGCGLLGLEAIALAAAAAAIRSRSGASAASPARR